LRIQGTEEDEFGEISYRPVASGGARHPIDVFVAALRVSELEEGIYQYNPLMHQLTPLDIPSTAAATLSKIALTALGDIPDILPGITLLFIAVPARTACKYEDMSLALIMKDLGCITQQLYLLIQGLGLTGCAVGGAEPTAIEEGLGLRTTQEVFVGGFVIW
jgi:SagB-type dehydrogenase family enzyme